MARSSKNSSAANSVDGGWVWRIIKLIQAFMGVHVTWKNEEGARGVTKDLPLRVYAYFYDAQGQLTTV